MAIMFWPNSLTTYPDNHVLRSWNVKMSCKWHTLTLIFANHGLFIWGRSISCAAWSNGNIRILEKIFSDTGLRTFQDIRDRYKLPANVFFCYLQLRLSLNVQSAPWNYHLTDYGCTFAPIWMLILSGHKVWANIREASRNPDHQQIHFNYVHRTYLTPCKLHYIKPISNHCNLCSMKASGTSLHMMWNCPPVLGFCSKMAAKLSELVSVIIPVTLPFLLLIHLSEVSIT